MATYSEKKEAIRALNDFGHNVLEVEIAGKSEFFIAKQFEAPVGGSVSAAPFLTFSGYNINNFLVNNIYSQGNLEMFKVKLEQMDRDTKSQDYQFSDLHVWRFYQ